MGQASSWTVTGMIALANQLSRGGGGEKHGAPPIIKYVKEECQLWHR